MVSPRDQDTVLPKDKTAASSEKDRYRRHNMIARMLMALSFLTALVVVGGFVALAFWDISAPQQKMEVTLDNGKFLTKSP